MPHPKDVRRTESNKDTGAREFPRHRPCDDALRKVVSRLVQDVLKGLKESQE